MMVPDESFSAHKPGDTGPVFSSKAKLIFLNLLHINVSFKNT